MKRTPLRPGAPLRRFTPLRRRTRVRAVSRTRAKGRARYVVWREGLFARRPRCELRRDPCFGRLTPHHIVRGTKGIVAEHEIAVLCEKHHHYVETHPAESAALGLLRSGRG